MHAPLHAVPSSPSVAKPEAWTFARTIVFVVVCVVSAWGLLLSAAIWAVVG
jgi:hypothetical protein